MVPLSTSYQDFHVHPLLFDISSLGKVNLLLAVVRFREGGEVPVLGTSQDGPL